MLIGQLQTLVSFSNAESLMGRKDFPFIDDRGETNSRAQSFLADFRRNYALPLQEIVFERSLPDAAAKFTAMWSKHVETLMEMIKDSKYIQFKPLVETINELATYHSFSSTISVGLSKGEHFTADTGKLAEGLKGEGRFSEALAQINNNVFAQIWRLASQNGDEKYKTHMKDMQFELLRKVKPAFELFKNADKTLAEIRSLQIKVSDGFRWL